MDDLLLNWKLQYEDKFRYINDLNLSAVCLFSKGDYEERRQCFNLEFLKDVKEFKTLGMKKFLSNLQYIFKILTKRNSLTKTYDISSVYITDLIKTYNTIYSYKVSWKLYQPLTFLKKDNEEGLYILININNAELQAAYLNKMIFCTTLLDKFIKYNGIIN